MQYTTPIERDPITVSGCVHGFRGERAVYTNCSIAPPRFYRFPVDLGLVFLATVFVIRFGALHKKQEC